MDYYVCMSFRSSPADMNVLLRSPIVPYATRNRGGESLPQKAIENR